MWTLPLLTPTTYSLVHHQNFRKIKKDKEKDYAGSHCTPFFSLSLSVRQRCSFLLPPSLMLLHLPQSLLKALFPITVQVLLLCLRAPGTPKPLAGLVCTLGRSSFAPPTSGRSPIAPPGAPTPPSPTSSRPASPPSQGSSPTTSLGHRSLRSSFRRLGLSFLALSRSPGPSLVIALVGCP